MKKNFCVLAGYDMFAQKNSEQGSQVSVHDCRSLCCFVGTDREEEQTIRIGSLHSSSSGRFFVVYSGQQAPSARLEACRGMALS